MLKKKYYEMYYISSYQIRTKSVTIKRDIKELKKSFGEGKEKLLTLIWCLLRLDAKFNILIIWQEEHITVLFKITLIEEREEWKAKLKEIL